MMEYYMGSPEDWKDSPIVKIVLITAATAVGSKVVRTVVGKVKEGVKGLKKVDLNKMVRDPKGQAHDIAEKMKEGAQHAGGELRSGAAYAGKKGITGVVTEQVVNPARERVQGTLCSLVEGKYATAAELQIPGVDAYIGEYLSTETRGKRGKPKKQPPVLRDTADQVRNFVTALRDDYDVLPLELGYDGDNPHVRKEVLDIFTGYATIDVDYVIKRLEAATTIDRFVLTDTDPTLREQELAVIRRCAGSISGLAAQYDAKEDSEGE